MLTFDLSNPYFPILLIFLIAIIVSVAISTMALLLGPKKPTQVKLDVYECGIPVAPNSAKGRLSVKFYSTALIFILFDIDTVFLYLWAIAFDNLGWFGVIEVGLFVVTLAVGYIYVIKRGALRWE